MKITKDTHVLLLKGGFGSEREVSLRSAKACSKAIKDNGLKVTEFDTGIKSITDLVKIKPDVCFNALHGKCGEDGSIQGFLNLLRIPYTHSGVTASAISMNKLYFKRLITNATENSKDPICFPKTLKILKGKKLSVKNYDGPFVVKPINGGSSVDVQIIKEGINFLLKKDLDHEDLMAEIFVGSKELTVTVLNEKPLCVTEIKTSQNQIFYNYKAKYDLDGSLHEIPAKIPEITYQQAMSWALRAHKTIGCRGISRSDFRYDVKDKKLYMLEINTQPGMTETSLSPEQASFCKISMQKMVNILLEEASYEC